MAARLIAAATASGVLCACLATIVVASGGPPVGSGLAALAGTAPEADVASIEKPPRPSPQPALTDPAIPSEASDAPAATDAGSGVAADDGDGRGADGRPHRPNLASAPREVLLYSKGCGIYRAVEPWDGGRTYDVEGLDRRTCAVQWTPGGDLVSVDFDDGGDRVGLLGRGGDGSRLQIRGYHVRGPVALDSDELVLCGSRRRASGPGVLFRWKIGQDVIRQWRAGCTPAISRTGVLAWSQPLPTEGGGPTGAVIAVDRGPQGGRLLARFEAGSVESLEWTGDSRLLVAVVRTGTRSRAFSIDRDGHRVLLGAMRGGTITAHPSPAGDRVILVRTVRGGLAQVHAVDPVSGRTEWFEEANVDVDVSWSPSGSRLLLADHRTWRFVEPASGIVRLQLGRLGSAPTWCCPEPVRAS